MSMLAVSVRRNGVHEYGLSFPYDVRFIHEIKTRIPAARRRYDAAAKVWWLSSADDMASLQWATSGWTTFHRGGDHRAAGQA